MKTPEELLEELTRVSEGFFGVSLFVGFEDSSIVLQLHHRTEVLPNGNIVYEVDPNFLPTLKEAISNGGVPIGWQRMKSKNAPGDVVELGPLQDQQKQPWVYRYLMHFYDPRDKKDGTKFYLVYPDGNVLDITDLA